MENKKTQSSLNLLEISAFCNQMSMILKSGISTIEGITILYDDSASAAEKELLEVVKKEMEQSGNLTQALKASGVFPDYMLNMVNLGEQTGRLDDVMEALSLHYIREDNISRSIKNALFYPLIMIFMMIAVISILLIKVMPVFNQMFIQLGQQMTGLSKAMLEVGNFLGKHSPIFIGILVLLFLLIFYFAATKNGRKAFVKIGYQFSILRNLYEKIATTRFASGIAMTLSSGMNPEQAIDLVGSLNDNPYFQKKIDTCKDLISSGTNFSDALSAAGVFSGMYAKMTSVASKTGNTDEIMQQLANQYEEEVDIRISSIISTLEPTLIIILSLIVGIILLSVMLPLMGIMSSL